MPDAGESKTTGPGGRTHVNTDPPAMRRHGSQYQVRT
jgi:hypothetical protein